MLLIESTFLLNLKIILVPVSFKSNHLYVNFLTWIDSNSKISNVLPYAKGP